MLFLVLGANFHSGEVWRGWFYWGSFTNLSCKRLENYAIIKEEAMMSETKFEDLKISNDFMFKEVMTGSFGVDFYLYI